MIAISFAVPHESRLLREALHHSCAQTMACGLEYTVGNLGREEVAVVHTGIGATAVARVLPPFLAELQPRWLLSAGFAGALDPALEVGDLVVEENLSAPHLDARAPADARRLTIATVDTPAATPEAKHALREQTGAAAVDMESRAIAEVCAAPSSSTPLLILRAISDDAATALPLDFATTWDPATQRPRIPAILRSLADDPGHWPPFATFLHHLDTAAASLATAIASTVVQKP